MVDLFRKSNPLKVAIVGQLNTRGGVQSCMLTLIRGLNRQGILPDILWDIPPAQDILQQEGVQAGFYPLRFTVPWDLVDRLPGSLAYLMQTPNVYPGYHLRERYDFFFLFYNGFLVTPDMPHVRYLSGPPLLPQLVVISPGVRGLPSRISRWIYQTMIRQTYPFYEYHRRDNYVINSQYTARLFEEAHGVRLPVVYPPIELGGHSFSADDLSQRDTITFFSRVVSVKRPEMVIELASRCKDLRCVIMGSVPPARVPYFDELKEKARAMGRPDIVFLATPSNERVLEELARTRFYVFPGVNEHFGMTTPEAIASGAIPFVHDSGGQREIVTDPRLRFTDEHFIDQFAAVAALPDDELNAIRYQLRAHVEQFSQNVFIEKIMAYMQPPTPASFAAHMVQEGLP